MHELPFDHPANQTPIIWHPDELRADGERIRVVWFKRSLRLSKTIARTRLWITASQRYELFLDGERIDRGPSRGDPQRWNCRRVSLGKLAAGTHTIHVRVTHFGRFSGVGQMGEEPFLLIAGEGDLQAWSTDERWLCWSDRSRQAIRRHDWGDKSPFYAAGCGESIDPGTGLPDPLASRNTGIDWLQARERHECLADIWGHLPLRYKIRQDPIPPMQESPVAFTRVFCDDEQLEQAARKWLVSGRRLRIPAGRRIRLILDRGEITNAWPRFRCAAGQDAICALTWVEAPQYEERRKGHRDEIDGKQFWGHSDRIRWAGTGSSRRPEIVELLHFRSFRYLSMVITTREEPLDLLGIDLTSTAYPLKQRGRFKAAGRDVSRYRRFMDVSMRTLRLCAHETFYDCPHYEQCQFPGDTRVQALAHYLIADDDRLVRKAIDDFHASRLADGMLLCKHPSTHLQVLPTYALAWIGMLHDFRIYRGDAGFLAPFLPAAREVIDWFWRRRRPDGLFGLIPHACFLDWAKGLTAGNAPQDQDGGSSILALQVREACQWLAALEIHAGYPELSDRWLACAEELGRAVKARCWDKERKLLRDTANGDSFSEHAQIQAVLAGLWPLKQGARTLRRATAAEDLIVPGSLYYRFFKIQACREVADPASILDSFRAWDRALAGTGLTTWPESDGTPRSDCHAWSVTPCFEVLLTVLGYRPDPSVAGFTRAIFAPHLGDLPAASGEIPTPQGPATISVARRGDGRLDCQVDSPVPLLIADRKRPLPPGARKLVLAEA